MESFYLFPKIYKLTKINKTTNNNINNNYNKVITIKSGGLEISRMASGGV